MELFFLKVMDGALGTLKSIFLYKNRKFLSALFSSMSMFFYLTMMVQITKTNSVMGILIVCAATFFGSYIPMFFVERWEKDKVLIYDITPDTNEHGKSFADMIRENNVALMTYKGYNKNKEQVLCCRVFSETKEQSRLIVSLIPNEFKYSVVETKNPIAS